MDQALMDRIKDKIIGEFDREGLPDGFPELPVIPAGRYTEQQFYDLEQEHMWSKTWLYAGRAEQLPRPGSYQLWDYSGPSIILVRDRQRRIRAFLNESPNNAPLVPLTEPGAHQHEMPFDAPGRMFMQVEFPDCDLPGGILQNCACSHARPFFCARTGRSRPRRSRKSIISSISIIMTAWFRSTSAA